MERQMEPLAEKPLLKMSICLTHLVMRMGNLALERLFGRESQINSKSCAMACISVPTPTLPLNCWLCGQIGHKKVNCPQMRCFYCGKTGHSKKICLNYRLAKMYDEERNQDSNSSSVNPDQASFHNLNTSKPRPAFSYPPFAKSTASPIQKKDVLENSNIPSNPIGQELVRDPPTMHTIGDLQPIVHTSPPITETLILTRINPTPLNQHEKYQRCSLCYYLSLSREQAMQHIRLKHANEIVKPELNMGLFFQTANAISVNSK